MDITIAKILLAINDSQGFMGMIVVVTEFHEHGKTTNGKFLNRNVQSTAISNKSVAHSDIMNSMDDTQTD